MDIEIEDDYSLSEYNSDISDNISENNFQDFYEDFKEIEIEEQVSPKELMYK